METLPAAVLAQIAATKSRPVSICEMYLNVGTIRFAASSGNVVFPTGGNTYTAISYNSGQKKTSIGNQMVTIDYQFDNRNAFLHALNAIESFKGKPFVEKIVWLDALTNATYYRERISGFMEEPKFDEKWMSLKVIDGKTLGQSALNEYFQRTCNNIYGDSKCNYNGYAAVLPDPNLIGDWKLDEGSGIIAVDSSGAGHDGSIVGAPSWVTGVSGLALSLDADSLQYVNIGASTAFNTYNTPFTVGARLYPTVDNGYLCVGTYYGNYKGFMLGRTWGFTIGEGAANKAITACSPPLNQWSFLVGTFDGTYMRAYLNGVLVGTPTAVTPASWAGQPFMFGRYGWAGSYGTGLIDEVKFLTRCLSADEIWTLYNNPDVIFPTSGTADSGTVSSLTDNALTQADDFWNFGTIDIIIGGYKYTRKVIDFVASTDTIYFDVELPVAVTAGCAYTVKKGCPRTWDACKKTYAYGPSADNSINFIGMIHLLKATKELD
jgi:hypothetical protein